MEVIRFLNGGCALLDNTGEEQLEFLKQEFGIKYSLWEHPLGTMVVLNYCQIESPKEHPITRECRSLVLELHNDEYNGKPYSYFTVVSRSFDRFFNYGETEQSMNYNPTDLVAYEKLDGSLVGLFCWKGMWLWRTRSMISPKDMQINGFDKTWQQLFEEALSFSNFNPDLALDKDVTYICELVGRENRVVIRYEHADLYLLGTRMNKSGQYINPQLYYCHGFSVPKNYRFSTFEDCLESAKELRDLKEGYVMFYMGKPVCKIKNPAYVCAHHLLGKGLNPKRICDLIIMNETDEYLSIFPEDKEMFEPYLLSWDGIRGIAPVVFEMANVHETQKDFALHVKDLWCNSLMFNMRKGLTFEQSWDKLTQQSKIKLILQGVTK